MSGLSLNITLGMSEGDGPAISMETTLRAGAPWGADGTGPSPREPGSQPFPHLPQGAAALEWGTAVQGWGTAVQEWGTGPRAQNQTEVTV